MLHIQIRESLIRVIIRIVRDLEVPVLQGMLSIDKFIGYIFWSERKMVLLISPPVEALTVYETETDKTEEQQERIVAHKITEQNYTQELVRVSHTVTLKPLTKTSILVSTI